MDLFEGSDDSSTEEEMKRLWDKLENMEAMAKKEVEENAPTAIFQCPSSISSASVPSSISTPSDYNGDRESPDRTMDDLTNKTRKQSTMEASLVRDTKPTSKSSITSISTSSLPEDRENIRTLGHPIVDLTNNAEIDASNANRQRKPTNATEFHGKDHEAAVDSDKPIAYESAFKGSEPTSLASSRLKAGNESSDSSDESSDSSNDDDSSSSSSSSDDGSSTSDDESSTTNRSNTPPQERTKCEEATARAHWPPCTQAKSSNANKSASFVSSSSKLVKNPYRKSTAEHSHYKTEKMSREHGGFELQPQGWDAPPIESLGTSAPEDGLFPFFEEDLADSSDNENDGVRKCSSHFLGSNQAAKTPTELQAFRPNNTATVASDENKSARLMSDATLQPSFNAEKEDAGTLFPKATDASFKRTDKANESGRSEDQAPPQNSKSTRIQEHPLEAEQEPEIHHSLYAPKPYRERQPPIVHKFNTQNRPLNSRRRIPVSSLFGAPLHLLWQTKFEHFNHLQSEVSNALCHTDDNLVVSAPTGAGKTAIFEMAMARFIDTDLQNQRQGQQGPRRLSKKRKIVYVAPSKALCEERYEDWSRRLSALHLGIEVAMITGGADPGNSYHDLTAAHFILTTPEKWDSLSRKWSENFYLLASVKMFMIDEVHLLGDESRGCCLESIVSRMKSIQRGARQVTVSTADLRMSSYPHTNPQAISSCMRVVAVSATLPNISDVADFLGANEAYAFDESYRPVPLMRYVVGLGYVGKNEFRFWSSLNRHVPELIHQYSNKKQTLVFCHTKKDTEQLVQLLISDGFGFPGAFSSSAPGTVQHCLDCGIAYHHAGIEPTDRRRIEQAFAGGKLRCLCATSTLAVGVNLPAHLVIVKGTKTWRGGGSGYQEIDKGALLQMVGRAGRPGFDTTGTAVIMTDNKSKPSIERLAQGLGDAESYLLPKLADVINTEISQRVITSMEEGSRWLKTTFLFSRILQEPKKFMDISVQTIDSYLLRLCDDSIKQLIEMGLVEVDAHGIIVPLAPCHIASQSMVPLEAMKRISDLPFDATQCQILKTVSKMESYHFMVRRNEKRVLNECHKSDTIRFKLDGPLSKIRIQDPSEKAFVLLQANIGQHSFENYTLRSEMTALADTAQRVLLAAQEHSVKGSKNGQVALQCLKLRRSLHLSLWNESSGVLNQIEDVGHECTKKLKFNGIISFEQAVSSSEEKIEKACGRAKPFGKQLRYLVSQLLSEKLKISAEIEYTRGSNIAAGVLCHLQTSGSKSGISVKKKANVTYTLLAYTDRPGTSMFFQDGITGAGSYRFSCPPKFGKLCIHLISSIVGMDESLLLDGNDDILESSYISSLGRKSMKSRGLSKAKPQQPKTNTAKKHRNIGDVPRLLQMLKPRQTVLSSMVRSSKGPRQRNDEANTGQNSPMSLVQKGGKDQGDSTATITPQKPTIDLTKQVPERRTWAEFSSQLATQKTPQCHDRNESRQQRDQELYVGAVVQKPTSERICDRLGERASMAQVASVTPMDYGIPRTSIQSNPQSSMRSHQEAAISRKRAAPSASWNQTKRNQEKSQQRAFARRKDNPFAFFQHDPNDAESFLDGLSVENNSKSSIIPERELEAFRAKTVNKGGLNTAPRGPYRGRCGQKRRRNFPIDQIISNQELLRMKAAEVESYSSRHDFVPRNPEPTSFSLRAEEQLNPPRNLRSKFSMDLDYESVVGGGYSRLDPRYPTSEREFAYQPRMRSTQEFSKIQDFIQRQPQLFHPSDALPSQLATPGFMEPPGWHDRWDNRDEIRRADGASPTLSYSPPQVLPQESGFAGSGYGFAGEARNSDMESLWTDREERGPNQMISPRKLDQSRGENIFDNAFF